MNHMLYTATLVAAICVTSNSRAGDCKQDQTERPEVELNSEFVDADAESMSTESFSEPWGDPAQVDTADATHVSRFARDVLFVVTMHPGIRPSGLTRHFECPLSDVVDAVNELLAAGMLLRSA